MSPLGERKLCVCVSLYVCVVLWLVSGGEVADPLFRGKQIPRQRAFGGERERQQCKC